MEQHTLALLEEMEDFQRSVVLGLDKIIDAARRWDQNVLARENSVNELQWHLGEARAKNQQYEAELQGKAIFIQDLENRCRELQQHFDESQWYLGEERSRRAGLEAHCRELEAQLNGKLQSA